MKLLQFPKSLLGTGGSRLGLSIDDKVSVRNLLYGLMLVSGNDAAVALGEFIAGSLDNFAIMMNEKCSELGLVSTHFVTPHGLDADEHFTTAYELAKIANYALKNETFAKIVKTSNYTININGNSKILKNTNELLGFLDGIYGVKTGFTNGANRCLVTSCKRGNLDIICVVLGCDTKKNRTLDSVNLINYTFNNFSVVNVREFIYKNFDAWALENGSSICVNKGVYSNIDFYLNDSQFAFDCIAINNDCVDNISTPISFTKCFTAPLFKDTSVGKLHLYIGDSFYFSVDILNKNTVKRMEIINYLDIFLKNYFNYFSTS